MLLIHKETAEIFELLVKGISEDLYFDESTGFPLAEIVLGNPKKNSMPRATLNSLSKATYDKIGEQFEILGWL